jgi:YbbR domain-containing protein
VDVSERTNSFTESLNLNEFLPEGVRLVERSENMVQIAIGIEPEASRQIVLQRTQLQIVNMPYGYECKFIETEEPSVMNLTGLRKDLDAIEESELIAEVDIAQYMDERGLEQLREGVYSIPLEIEFGPNITITNTATVQVGISPVTAPR